MPNAHFDEIVQEPMAPGPYILYYLQHHKIYTLPLFRVDDNYPTVPWMMIIPVDGENEFTDEHHSWREIINGIDADDFSIVSVNGSENPMYHLGWMAGYEHGCEVNY